MEDSTLILIYFNFNPPSCHPSFRNVTFISDLFGTQSFTDTLLLKEKTHCDSAEAVLRRNQEKRKTCSPKTVAKRPENREMCEWEKTTEVKK